jgi:hypothetical protein
MVAWSSGDPPTVTADGLAAVVIVGVTFGVVADAVIADDCHDVPGSTAMVEYPYAEPGTRPVS